MAAVRRPSPAGVAPGEPEHEARWLKFAERVAKVLGVKPGQVRQLAVDLLAESAESYAREYQAALDDPQPLPRPFDAEDPRLPPPLDRWLTGDPAADERIAELHSGWTRECLLRAVSVVREEEARNRSQLVNGSYRQVFLAEGVSGPSSAMCRRFESADYKKLLRRVASVLLRHAKPWALAADIFLTWAPRFGVPIEEATEALGAAMEAQRARRLS
jgi:hypothetical protein